MTTGWKGANIVVNCWSRGIFAEQNDTAVSGCKVHYF